MDIRRQLDTLCNIGDNTTFVQTLEAIRRNPLRATGVEILQINVGRLCNLSCMHCHVEAGPSRKESMSRAVFEKCLDILKHSTIPTIDITGGSPEMNPNLEWFLGEVAGLGRRVLVRSNLVILLNLNYRKFIDIYERNRVEIVASLPCYTAQATDKQRGDGAYVAIVEVLKILNDRGYGCDGSGLVLDLVHNPTGACLSGSQQVLEREYRLRLKQDHDVLFNRLFCLTNLPVGRYLNYLLESGNYMGYMAALVEAFNPAALDRVMCKTTVSVGWDGALYDCDFNQMLQLPVNHGAPDHITRFDIEKLKNRQIVIANHCFGCTAGAGSSCQGQIACS